MARSFEQIYVSAPKAAVGRLLAFRERYSAHYEDHHGKAYRVWDINDCENPKGTVVFLPSAMGSGEIWFPFMLNFARDMRMIAFSYADDEDPGVMAGAFLDILEKMGAERFVIAANSVGGLIAQIMAVKAPQRVLGMSLMMTGTPSADLDARSKAKWEQRRKIRLRLRFQSYSPAQRLSMAGQVFDSICPEPYRESQSFWLGFIEETFGEHVYKSQHLAINTSLVPNIYAKYAFRPEDFSADIKVQIIESDGDALYSREERECLKRLFPNAAVFDIGGAGQFSLQLMEKDAIETLERFLAGIFA